MPCEYVELWARSKMTKTHFGENHSFLRRLLGLEWDYCSSFKEKQIHYLIALVGAKLLLCISISELTPLISIKFQFQQSYDGFIAEKPYFPREIEASGSLGCQKGKTWFILLNSSCTLNIDFAPFCSIEAGLQFTSNVS